MMELESPPLSSEICSRTVSITPHFLNALTEPTIPIFSYEALDTSRDPSCNQPFVQRTRENQPMAPLVPFFSAGALPDHVNIVTKNFHEEKRRKGGAIELEKCKLLEMVQYSCNPPQDGIPQPGVVVCKPVVRLFRRFVTSRLLLLPVSHPDSSQMRRWLDG
jgi:hypothetical protein